MKRTDANQKSITEQLRKCGFSVLVLSMVGHGCPDILIGAKNRNFLIEIKDGQKIPSQRKLTEDEQKFFARWKGQVNVCNSFDEIMEVINAPIIQTPFAKLKNRIIGKSESN